MCQHATLTHAWLHEVQRRAGEELSERGGVRVEGEGGMGREGRQEIGSGRVVWAWRKEGVGEAWVGPQVEGGGEMRCPHSSLVRLADSETTTFNQQESAPLSGMPRGG